METTTKNDDHREVHGGLPEKPSRGSSRWYIAAIFLLTIIEAVVVVLNNYEHWKVLAAINAAPLFALLIAKAATSLDLNKWMDSATRMVEAKYQK